MGNTGDRYRLTGYLGFQFFMAHNKVWAVREDVTYLNSLNCGYDSNPRQYHSRYYLFSDTTPKTSIHFDDGASTGYWHTGHYVQAPIDPDNPDCGVTP